MAFYAVDTRLQRHQVNEEGLSRIDAKRLVESRRAPDGDPNRVGLDGNLAVLRVEHLQ